MLTETEARAAALAALDKLRNTRSGRVHAEMVMRPEASLMGAHFDITSSTDAVVNLDQPASMAVNEMASEASSAAEEKSESRRQTNESRTFPAEGLAYRRLIQRVSRTQEANTAAESADVVFDNTDEAEPVRWSVLTREILGPNQDLEANVASDFAYPELEVLLADPEQKVLVDRNSAGQTLLDLPTDASRIPKFLSALQIIEYPPEMPFTVRLTIGPGGLAGLTLLLPPSALNSYLDLIDSVVINFWRIGEAITIQKPDPEECFPPVPPVSTTITECNLQSSERYLSFTLDGRQYTDRLFWDPDEDSPYVPLAVGDQLRITGSRRPFFRTKANKALTFNLWAAWKVEDGQLIQDFRKDDSSPVTARFLAHYRRTTDVIDQVVTLTGVQPIEEPVKVQFEDALVGESDDDDYLMVERSVLAAAGVEAGAAVTLYGYNMPLGTLIYRMELADGTSIP